MKILLLSDNHGYVGEELGRFAENCEEVWHAGDWLNLDLHHFFESKGKKLRGVTGNIDGTDVKAQYDGICEFELYSKRFLIYHIVGYPGKYANGVQDLISSKKPDVLICGHSHVLRVMRDKPNNLLYLNPGACGTHGFHKIRTALRFTLNEAGISEMEAIEFGPRSPKFEL